MNTTCMIGRMVRDPELRTTNTGKNVVEFTLAVDKRVKPTDPNQPAADFFRWKAWNQQADFLSNYGGKGRLVAATGRAETRKYVDKDGNNREVVEFVADNVQLLDRARDGSDQSGSPSEAAARQQRPAATNGGADDVYDQFGDE